MDNLKIIAVIIIVALQVSLHGQSTTYSKYEEKMVTYANNGWSYAEKYDSLEIAEVALDSCWRFIDKYPYSFAKPNVLSFMLEMTVMLSNDKNKIYPLIDSVLTYDKLLSTKLRVGQILVENNLDVERGREIIIDALPHLITEQQKFNAYITIARSDVSNGKFVSAQNYYEKALEIHPEWLAGWYECLSTAKIGEMGEKTKYLESRINKIEESKREKSASRSTVGPNINKQISELVMDDLDEQKVDFKTFHGKLLVINRFNFWCGWCAKEFPALQKIIAEFPNVNFVFVNYGETPEELKEIYFKKSEFSFLKEQIVLQGDSKYLKTIHGNGVPHTLVVDKKGKVRYDYLGYKENLEELLRKNLFKLNHE